MVKIVVDGREHEVEEGQNLLRAVLGLGYDLPYFCWHPALHSVGACRQCAVKQFRDADDESGMIIMACTTPVSDGLRISIDDPEAREMRAAVIEWYMTNHPHDCPVCDEGGECHLQDMTVMSGHRVRGYRFNKRTHRNQDLGPFINHEMNRCIQCYRCVRFYRDYAGGADFNVFGSRNRVYFGRVSDGTLESPFSGNLVEICPTGVFTDKTAKARSVRPWDLQTAPSICGLCGIGCNTLPGERNGALRRIRNRYHGEINRYFLCDRGRFGFEFVNSPHRLRRPMIRTNSGRDVVGAGRAIEHVAGLIHDGGAIGIGSPRASLEANFALRELVGAENFFMGIGSGEATRLQIVVDLVKMSPVPTPTLRDIEACDAVLILGEDITNTAPLLDLAVRQAVLNDPLEEAKKLGIPDWNDFFNRLVVNNRQGPLFIATPAPTALDRLATETVRAAPQDIARLGYDIAAALAGGPQSGPSRIAETLSAARAPLIITGMGAGSAAVIEAAAKVAAALDTSNPAAGLCLAVPDCNSMGAGLIGAPGLGAAAGVDGTKTVIVLEPDPCTRERRMELTTVLDGVPHVVVLDILESSDTDSAEVVLPAATIAESTGTLVNAEGRAQRFCQVFVPAGEVRASWRWLGRIRDRVAGRETPAWPCPDDVVEAMAESLPVFQPVIDLAPSSDGFPLRRIPRQSHRVTGRTAVTAHRNIREPKPPTDRESPMTFSMEGSPHRPPADLINRYWSPGWNSVQSLTRFQEEIGGALRGGDPGIRLLDARPDDIGMDFGPLPESFKPKDGEWLLVPLHHLHGSESLSLETEGVREQAPEPYLGLNPADADRFGPDLELEIGGSIFQLPCRTVDGLPPGCAGLPEGLPGLSDLPAGRRAKIRRAP